MDDQTWNPAKHLTYSEQSLIFTSFITINKFVIHFYYRNSWNWDRPLFCSLCNVKFSIYLRVKWMASSRYCKLNSTRARFSRTSAFDGEIESARRKQSIDMVALPFIRQKLPIWLNNCTDSPRSRFAFFNRFSNTSILKFFKLFMFLCFRNCNATWIWILKKHV